MNLTPDAKRHNNCVNRSGNPRKIEVVTNRCCPFMLVVTIYPESYGFSIVTELLEQGIRQQVESGNKGKIVAIDIAPLTTSGRRA